HFERFDPERPVLPWLIAIARRLCLDLLRRRKMTARIEAMPVSDQLAPSPEGEASFREQLARLDRALADLDEGPREAIILFHTGARRRYLEAIASRERRAVFTGLAAAVVGLVVIATLLATTVEPAALVMWLAEAMADLARWTTGVAVVFALVPLTIWTSAAL